MLVIGWKHYIREIGCCDQNEHIDERFCKSQMVQITLQSPKEKSLTQPAKPPDKNKNENGHSLRIPNRK